MNKNRTHAFIAKELGKCIAPITKEAFRKRGFAEHRIIGEWDNIVGAHLAESSAPLKVSFEANKKIDGVLHIQVLSVRALDFQHLEPMIVDRIATYFGYKAISRLVLHQTNVLASKIKREEPLLARRNSAPITPNLSSVIAGCEDPDLRARLSSLGALLGEEKKNH